MVSTPPITAEDLFAMGSDAPHELIAGEQREERPSSIESSMIAAALIERIAPFVRERRLGIVSGAQGGSVLSHNPDTVVASDVAVVRRERRSRDVDLRRCFCRRRNEARVLFDWNRGVNDRMGQLEGKLAIVTGAGSGLGKACALALAAEGSAVVVTELPDKLDLARATVAEVEAGGGTGQALPLDVRDLAQIERCVADAAAITGRIDILVNNAGVNIRRYAFDVTEADWDGVLDVNLKGVFFMAQAVGRVMRDQQPAGGAIINMASVMGLIGYYQRAAYCSSKAGVVNLTRVLAVEWAEHNIRVNAVCPTFVDTPLTRPMFESQPEFTADVMKRTLLGRLATPEEIAAAVVFLASPGAAMVHGHALAVDGGWTAI